jgi:3-phenylpropionate/trans-cinnamate dioxygenase ferredoxin reductase subunit
MDQARTAAATLNGNPQPYHAVPWFWSDQYDVKLQIAGLSQGYDSVVLRGDPGNGRLAVDAINRPGEFMAGKKLLLAGTPVDRQKLADESIPIKDFLS